VNTWACRVFLLLVCGTSGFFLVRGAAGFPHAGLWGMGAGFFLFAVSLLLENRLKKVPFRNLAGGLIGLMIGFLLARFISNVFYLDLPEDRRVSLSLLGLIYAVFGYIGLRTGLKKAEELHLPGWELFSKKHPGGGGAKILDTSVIIDGRISDITETGFLEGPLMIPRFVLGELQHIADSSDPIKRTRGKRGLEVLRHVQKQVNVDVRIIDTDYPGVKEVDSKLIEMAREVGGKIVTNDSNLNKVAELQGIDVLNINELANALKPVVLPGEEMNAKIVKEGKEAGQGVAYLDDGTMIVVDGGRRQIGKTVDVIVTSVLQTPAGRMIFGRLKEEPSREAKGKELFYPLDTEF